ncbi:hypothetical protein LTS18_002633 [Coniosporium uncinatum]|uniref:Uncharacterized protein n=1 Tax=Coniosporium uncinatum TaxID=93489 RepID=A0ACC3DUB3_9PEZI|nr:hypothetical protein LTS18_002633 [Coniosporium uncinatum]
MAEVPTIRLATREDVGEILSMIKELAEFEHALDKVEATESSLLQTLAFAPSRHRHHHEHHHDKDNSTSTNSKQDSHAHNSLTPSDAPLSGSAHNPPHQNSGYAKTLLLQDPSTAEVAGMALFYHTYSTWQARPGIYLEDLFIRTAHRRKGYATMLLQELARETERIGGGRLEWSCLKWNQNALDFYEGEKVGARQLEEWTGLRVEREELDKLGKAGWGRYRRM